MAKILLCLVLLALYLYLSGGACHSVADAPFPTIFQFGDSLSDTGNGLVEYPGVPFYRELGWPPYGETFFKRPTGRDSDGRLIIDFLATGLGLPMLEPYPAARGRGNYSHGANFAIAGAVSLDLETYAKYNVTISGPAPDLNLQLQRFLEFQKAAGAKKGKLPDPSQFSKALYVVGEIGGNDYRFMAGQPQLIIQQLAPLVVKSVGKHIRSLYEAGGRKFLVINMPLQGCVAGIMANAKPSDQRDELGCLAEVNKRSEYHNVLLKAEVEQLRYELEDAIVSYGDFFAVHKAVLQNPQAYGFSEALTACCGTYTDSASTTVNCAQNVFVNGKVIRGESCSNPSAHICWDSGHFTDRFNSIVASGLLSFNELYVDPPLANQEQRRTTQQSLESPISKTSNLPKDETRTLEPTKY